jgi:hypothetical protein
VKPSATIAVAIPAPNQPKKRCTLTFRTRTSADCTMKKITHVAKAAPCTHRMSGRGGLAWNRLASTVWLNPHTTSPAIASDMQK